MPQADIRAHCRFESRQGIWDFHLKLSNGPNVLKVLRFINEQEVNATLQT